MDGVGIAAAVDVAAANEETETWSAVVVVGGASAEGFGSDWAAEHEAAARTHAVASSAPRLLAPVDQTLATTGESTLTRVDVTFEFEAVPYLWDARDDASWVFVSLPVELAEDIGDLELPRRGFGSIKVRARTGSSEWRTSIFPDSKSGSYVLPLRKAVRTANEIEVGREVSFELDIAPE